MFPQRRNIFLLIVFLLIIILIIVAKIINSNIELSLYTYFDPSDQNPFQVRFEYPTQWEWSISDGPLGDCDGSMSIGDPSIPTPPMGFEPDFKRGIILICLKEINPEGFSALMYENNLLDHWLENPYLELQSDEIIEVNGYNARRIVVIVSPGLPVVNKVTLIDESIFVVVENKYYQFSLTIPMSDRLGTFGLDFDHLIESIEFLP